MSRTVKVICPGGYTRHVPQDARAIPRPVSRLQVQDDGEIERQYLGSAALQSDWPGRIAAQVLGGRIVR